MSDAQDSPFKLESPPVALGQQPPVKKKEAKARSTVNHYRIEGPATINFSGGRTSGYMLWRSLQEGLQPDVYVTFSDTGHERQETYDFIRNIEKHWGVKVHWLKREPAPIVLR